MMSDIAESSTHDLAGSALSEVVHVGTGRALGALERIIGRGSVNLSLPQVGQARLVSRLYDLEAYGTSVRLDVSGRVACTLYALFDEPSTRVLAGWMLGRRGQVETFGDVERSAIAELVNIMGCVFLDAMGQLVQSAFVPSPPHAEDGLLARSLQRELAAHPSVTVMTSRFDDAARGFSGRFVLLADEHSVAELLVALGVAAE